MESQQPIQQTSTFVGSHGQAPYYATATGHAFVDNGWRFAPYTPRTTPASHQQKTASTLDSYSYGNFSQDILDTHASDTASIKSDSTNRWTLYLQVDAFASLTVQALSAEHRLANISSRLSNHQPSTSNGTNNLSNRNADGDDGWNGREITGIDFFEPEFSSAMYMTLQAGEMARTRRGYRPTSYSFGEQSRRTPLHHPIEDVAVTDPMMRNDFERAMNQRGNGNTTGVSKQKVKAFFHRVFHSAKRWRRVEFPRDDSR